MWRNLFSLGRGKACRWCGRHKPFNVTGTPEHVSCNWRHGWEPVNPGCRPIPTAISLGRRCEHGVLGCTEHPAPGER